MENRKKYGLNKILIIGILFIIAVWILSINALSLAVDNPIIESTANKLNAKKGQEIIVQLAIKDIDPTSEGINVVQATIDFDERIFEELTTSSFELQNNWKQLRWNNENKQFIVINETEVKQDSIILTISFKVKEIVAIGDTDIIIKDMITSYGSLDIQTEETKVQIDIISTNINDGEDNGNNNIDDNKEDVNIDSDRSIDDTISPDFLPYTGENTTRSIIALIILLFIGISLFFLYKHMKLGRTLIMIMILALVIINTKSAYTITYTREDINILQKYLIELESIDDVGEETRLDLDLDGRLTVTDLTLLIRKLNNDDEEIKKLEEIATKSAPEILNFTQKQEKDNITFNFEIKDEDSTIKTIRLVIEDSNKNILKNEILSIGQSEYVVINLFEEGTYTVKFIANYDLSDEKKYTDEVIYETKIIILEEIVESNILTAHEMVEKMTLGWNLGNTLDSCDYKRIGVGTPEAVVRYEKLWTNPVTTEEMIQVVADSGINVIRIPVTYYDHIDDNGVIDSLWLDRVEEVVNYVLDAGLYCIIDVHHDSGLYTGGSWIRADNNDIEKNQDNVELLWTQIADRFKDYGYELMFEGLNEVVNTDKNYDWVTGYRDTLSVMKLNQTFVDTVRKAGGKNADRVLIVTTFGGITDSQKLETFTLPINPLTEEDDDKVILAVHDYARTTTSIDNLMNRLNTYILERDIPVIINEFGTTPSQGTEEERAEIAEYYVKKANETGIKCFWWDDGGSYILLNRNQLTWRFPLIIEALINGIK